jgi:CheY-like chemotaxis protein/HPt (histidine-containing phosphotransfer) domain-containing protein
VGDPVRLKQVLNNLLGNAFKFTQRGAVTLRVKPLRPATAEAAILVFEVEDTGIGIADNAKEKLFQAFSQADAATAFHFGGTGLGLYISQQIVEMMSGRIDFLSEPGKGSCFRFAAAFAVDVRDPAEIARSLPQPEEEPAPDLRVLIVEDHPINQKVLEGLLSMHGLKADHASDGVEALNAFARKSYDLVLMDSHMPGMDGFECTRKLRERTSSERPVIVGVTADAMTGSRERCLEAGMDEMITKPIMERDLVRVLSRWKKEKEPEAPQWTATAPTAPSNGAVEANDWIDFAQMEEMNAWILQYKPGFWDNARGQFDDAYRRQTRAIREACGAGRFQEAGEAAHAFKGVCMMLGFRRMGEICGSLEAMGLGGDTLRWRELMAELEAAREPSLKAWNGWVKK